jgi:hypothetical protein
MTRTVCTYFDRLEGALGHESAAILRFWERAWAFAGWNPVVLNRRIAESAPDFVPFLAEVHRKPTINPREYEDACYLRWLALRQSGGGLLADLDVFPLDGANHHLHTPDGDPVFLHAHRIPALVWASEAGAADICRVLVETPVPDGGKHESDMTILQRVPVGVCVPVCNLHGQTKDGDMAIHFAHSACGNERLKLIAAHTARLAEKET